jgi:agmatinase
MPDASEPPPQDRPREPGGPAGPRGPVDPAEYPRFTGPATFARLPRLDEVTSADVAVLGAPFDAGTTYRPGARFGPQHIRASSKLLRAYHPPLDVLPFEVQQVVDAGDVALDPFHIPEAVTQLEAAARRLGGDGLDLLTLGGDHTVALPLLRAVHARHGPVAVLHFDAHLDTWDTVYDAPFTHATPFRRAAEEGLLDRGRCLHVGIRGSLRDRTDLEDDAGLGFRVVTADEYQDATVAAVVERVRARLGAGPVYVSVDVDVLDPAHAPGTGTPEAGGLTSRELLLTLRGIAGLDVVGADVVEVAPAYDHAEITGIAAAHVAYELLAIMGRGRPRGRERVAPLP